MFAPWGLLFWQKEVKYICEKLFEEDLTSTSVRDDVVTTLIFQDGGVDLGSIHGRTSTPAHTQSNGEKALHCNQ